jgi:hypothetical protein
LERRETSLRLYCLYSNLILDVRTLKLEKYVDCMVWTEFTVISFSVIVELSPLPLLKYAILLSLIPKLMVTCWMTDGEHS